MKMIKSITLDLENRQSTSVMGLTQGDHGAWILRIGLMKGNMQYVPPEGTSVSLRCLKPDGCSCEYPMELVGEGVVQIELPQQALVVPGRVVADIVLRGSGGEILSSGSFFLVVDPAPVGEQVASSNEFAIMAQMIQEGRALIEELEQAADQGNVSGVQADWDINDPELAGYVKNRTHWVEYGDEVIIVPETTLTTTEDSAGEFYIEAAIPVEVGKTYTIVYNGTAYSCTAVDGAVLHPEFAGAVIFGNYGAVLGTGDTGEPFAIAVMPGEAVQLVDFNGATSVTISVSDNGEIVHKLDKKYLPDDIGGGGIFTVTVSDDESGNCTADKSLAEMASAYMAGKVLQCMYNETILHLHTAQPAVGVYAFTGAITANQMDKRIIMFAEGSIYMFTAEATVPKIPTKLPNPHAVFFYRALGGTATSIKNATYGTHKSDGSSALRIHGIANPYALTINGTTYDGSSAKDLTDVINAMIDTKLSSLTSAEEVAF